MGPGHSLKFSLAQLGPPVAGGEWNDLTFGTQFSVKKRLARTAQQGNRKVGSQVSGTRASPLPASGSSHTSVSHIHGIYQMPMPGPHSLCRSGLQCVAQESAFQ